MRSRRTGWRTSTRYGDFAGAEAVDLEDARHLGDGGDGRGQHQEQIQPAPGRDVRHGGGSSRAAAAGPAAETSAISSAPQQPGRGPGNQGLGRHGPVTARRRRRSVSGLRQALQMRETGNPSVQDPKVAARSTSVMKRDNAAKSWIVACNSTAMALSGLAHGIAGLNFSMFAASIGRSLQRVCPC